MNLPLSTAFTVSHRFWVVVFSFSFISLHILISFLISSMICWLFRSVLFSLPMLEFLIVFSFNWDLILLHCGQKRWLEWFHSFFEFTKARFMAQDLIHPGEGPCALEKKVKLIVWCEIPYRYQLGLAGPLGHLKFVFLVNFLFSWSIHRCE